MNYETYARRIGGKPTLRARIRRRVGGAICRCCVHRPTLVKSTTTSQSDHSCPCSVSDTAQRPDFQAAVQLFGVRAEKRRGREVLCRRCLAPCGDTIAEVTR